MVPGPKHVRALLEARELPPGADLKRVFVEAILKWMDAGWNLKEFHSVTGNFRRLDTSSGNGSTLRIGNSCSDFGN